MDNNETVEPPRVKQYPVMISLDAREIIQGWAKDQRRTMKTVVEDLIYAECDRLLKQ